MPGGILKKLATDSKGISGVVALALAGPATGCADADAANSRSADTTRAGVRNTMRALPERAEPSTFGRRRSRKTGAWFRGAASPKRQHSATIRRMHRYLVALLLVLAPVVGVAQDHLTPGALPPAERPFGTLREQAALQQQWLKKR